MDPNSIADLPPSQTTDHLLVFIKHPVPGYTKTRLISSQGEHGAAEISRLLTEHTMTIAHDLQQIHPPLRTFIYHANPENVSASMTEQWLRPNEREQLIEQQGDTLGHRMTNAIEYSFNNQMARKVIVIGSDSPHITPQLIQHAFRVLDHADLVIGPALDGGYYLIGMTQLHKALFLDIPWSTDTVFSETVAKAYAMQLSIEKLQPLLDIDELDDLLLLPTFESKDSQPRTFGKP